MGTPQINFYKMMALSVFRFLSVVHSLSPPHPFFFGLFRAVLAAYGSSQAGGPICLLSYATSTAMNLVCNLHHSSWQRWILNTLIEARIKPVSSWILVRFVTTKPQRELPMAFSTCNMSIELLM